MIRRRPFIALLGALLLGAALPAGAEPSLVEAKARGLVGERPDGLLGIVTASPSAEIRSLVERINAERRQQYQQIARSTGRSLAEVQSVAGQRLIQATPAGQYVQDAGGRWFKK
ncbi:MAG TPA: YdbL family protein [Candidatus Competibacteraceae bacterium]|nr:YdbL family protein [Candidatus Competibacteraceae bacterium]